MNRPHAEDNTQRPRLILASASPRRRGLLGSRGVEFVVKPSNVPEVAAAGEDAAHFVQRIALEKARAVAAGHPGFWVLGADTGVVVDADLLGKPADAIEARAMLGRLSGRAHRVLTGVALIAPGGEESATFVAESIVEFRVLSAAEIDAYVASGEPFDKAGAYGIQGGAAAFVRRVTGSYTNVIGLPLEEVCALLREHGLTNEEM